MRRQGSGTFVRGRVEKNFSMLTSFSEDMRARGRTPRSEWLKRSVGTVTPEESLSLRSSPGTPVFRFHRLRFADDAPMALEYATIVGVMPALTRCCRELPVPGARPRREPAGARVAASTRRSAHTRAGRAPAREAGRCRIARRASGISRRRPSRRILAVLLPRRYLRLRRRAQHAVVNPRSRMFREAAEGPAIVRHQLHANRDLVESIGDLVRQRAPRAVVTCARGSSDHAATFAKYLVETRTGLLASSAAPSVSSIYESKHDLDRVLFIAISQSGASPDLLATVAAARDAGALVLALVNAEQSPLARAAHHSIPLRAGAETSVAATKSYIASLSAIVHLVASWTRDHALHGGIGGCARTARERLATRLEHRGRSTARCAQPVRDRPRPRAGYRAGGRAEVQGDVRAARRGVQRRGAATRPDGAREQGFPGARPDAARRDARKCRDSCRRAEPDGRATSCWPDRRSRARARCRRSAPIRRSNRC